MAGLIRRLFGRPAAVEPGDGSASAETEPENGRGWQTLPPTPSAVPGPSLTVQTSAFENGLTTRRNPLFLEPLGHYVSGAGPSGTVEGIADVVAPRDEPRAQIVQTFAPRPLSVDDLRSAVGADPSSLVPGAGSGPSKSPGVGPETGTLSAPVLQRIEIPDAERHQTDPVEQPSLTRAPSLAPLPFVLEAAHHDALPSVSQPIGPAEGGSSDRSAVDATGDQASAGRQEPLTLAPAPARGPRVSRITEISEPHPPSPPIDVGAHAINQSADAAPTVASSVTQWPPESAPGRLEQAAGMLPVQNSGVAGADGPGYRPAGGTPESGARPSPRLGLGPPIRQVPQTPPGADPLALVQRRGSVSIDSPPPRPREPVTIPAAPVPTEEVTLAPKAADEAPAMGDEGAMSEILGRQAPTLAPGRTDGQSDVPLLGATSSTVLSPMHPVPVEEGAPSPSSLDRRPDPLSLTVQPTRADIGDAAADRVIGQERDRRHNRSAERGHPSRYQPRRLDAGRAPVGSTDRADSHPLYRRSALGNPWRHTP